MARPMQQCLTVPTTVPPTAAWPVLRAQEKESSFPGRAAERQLYLGPLTRRKQRFSLAKRKEDN